jgi:hypothetical protein
MAKLTAETVKKMAHELHGYELSDEAAASLAHATGALAAHSRRIASLDPGGVQPPFAYPILLAEAERIRRVNR